MTALGRLPGAFHHEAAARLTVQLTRHPIPLVEVDVAAAQADEFPEPGSAPGGEQHQDGIREALSGEGECLIALD